MARRAAFMARTLAAMLSTYHPEARSCGET
jgi:hypothetical protein